MDPATPPPRLTPVRLPRQIELRRSLRDGRNKNAVEQPDAGLSFPRVAQWPGHPAGAGMLSRDYRSQPGSRLATHALGGLPGRTVFGGLGSAVGLSRPDQPAIAVGGGAAAPQPLAALGLRVDRLHAQSAGIRVQFVDDARHARLLGCV